MALITPRGLPYVEEQEQLTESDGVQFSDSIQLSDSDDQPSQEPPLTTKHTTRAVGFLENDLDNVLVNQDQVNQDQENLDQNTTIPQRLVVPRGHKLRDEFVCPITRELMADPVIAADGHTYDRTAIERWLQTHISSPKTGQPLDHLHLVPNHNLQRLLRDMFLEGGSPLWCPDDASDDEPQLALVLERVLNAKCLGPAETDWMGRTFRVTVNGVLGGRRRPNENTSPSRRDFVQFMDATVSRKHFDIQYDHNRSLFALRDLGSAGGTFIRIPPSQPTPLHPGMRIMLGKHQLEVMLPTLHAPHEDEAASSVLSLLNLPSVASTLSSNHEEDHLPRTANLCCTRRSSAVDLPQDHLEDVAASTDIYTPKYTEIAAMMRRFDLCGPAAALRRPHFDDVLTDHEETDFETDMLMDQQHNPVHCDPSSTPETDHNEHQPLLVLRCYAPEGTPIQGREFPIAKNGATLGRKPQNTISFSHTLPGTEPTIVGIDSSISGEHATISYNSSTQQLELQDGSNRHGSTNGTWIRLSGMHQQSEPYYITQTTEILVGTVRFLLTMDEAILERDFLGDKNEKTK